MEMRGQLLAFEQSMANEALDVDSWFERYGPPKIRETWENCGKKYMVEMQRLAVRVAAVGLQILSFTGPFRHTSVEMTTKDKRAF